jgi:hypothetical protein
MQRLFNPPMPQIGAHLQGLGEGGWLDKLTNTVSKVSNVVQSVAPAVTNVRSAVTSFRQPVQTRVPGTNIAFDPNLRTTPTPPAQRTGMSLPVKIGIGVGIAALGYLAFKKLA